MRRLLVILTLILLVSTTNVYAEEIEDASLTTIEDKADDFNGYEVIDADELGSFIINSKKSSYNCSQINFQCAMPEGFNLGVYLELENETEGLKFRLTATSANGFLARIYVPEGDYRVLNCYVAGDTTMKYPMKQPGDFAVKASKIYTIKSTLVNYEEVESEAQRRLNGSEETIPSDASSKNSEEEKLPFWRTVTCIGEGAAKLKITRLCKVPLDLIVKITATGGDRKGEYKYSTDGGDTWSQIQVIKTSSDQMILLTDGSDKEAGLKLRFEGSNDYLMYDEYRFSCPIEYRIEDIGNVGRGEIELASDEIIYNDSYKFIMKITKTGGLGKGKFSYSLNEGVTWSEDILIPKNGIYEIPKTKLKIGFFDGNGNFMVSDTYKSEVKGDMSKRDYTPYLIGFILICATIIYMIISHYVKMRENPDSYRLHVYEPVVINRKKRHR